MKGSDSARCRRRRPGFALPLAVLVLALLALLVAGAVEAARAARRSSALAEADAALQSVAESAVADLASDWTSALNDLAVGDRAAFSGPSSRSGVTSSVRVTRIAIDVWWVTAESRLGAGTLAADGGGATGRRRINAVLTLGALGMPAPASLVAAGSVVVAAPFAVGVDSTAVACPATRGDSAVVVGPSDSVGFAGGAAAVPWRRDPVAGDASAIEHWGATDWSTLVAAADFELPAGSSTAAEEGCGPGAWGTTGGPGCGATPRVVHATGDLTLAGGSGAGVLLVDGRLRIAGALRYSGLIAARGGIDFEGAGSTITGGVIAGSAGGSGAAVRVGGATALRTSSCAVWLALARGAIPRPAPGRWWAELL